jgi:antitoxin component HigA of HigAB toxin-antitoxin module
MNKARLTKDERDYLEVLSILVERYEARLAPLDEPSHAAMLAHLMDAKAVSQADVSRGTGISPATISNVRAGRRDFSKADIRKLCDYFHSALGAWL